MTYYKVIFCFCLLLTAAFTQAQENLSPEKVKELTELYQSIQGTYQIQLNGIRKQPSIHLSMATKIEDARDETEITFLPYGQDMRILILPRQTIGALNFVPIKPISHIYTDEPAY